MLFFAILNWYFRNRYVKRESKYGERWSLDQSGVE